MGERIKERYADTKSSGIYHFSHQDQVVRDPDHCGDRSGNDHLHEAGAEAWAQWRSDPEFCDHQCSCRYCGGTALLRDFQLVAVCG